MENTAINANHFCFFHRYETRVMHKKSDNIEIMSGIETIDAINELFNTFR